MQSVDQTVMLKHSVSTRVFGIDSITLSGRRRIHLVVLFCFCLCVVFCCFLLCVICFCCCLLLFVLCYCLVVVVVFWFLYFVFVCLLCLFMFSFCFLCRRSECSMVLFWIASYSHGLRRNPDSEGTQRHRKRALLEPSSWLTSALRAHGCDGAALAQSVESSAKPGSWDLRQMPGASRDGVHIHGLVNAVPGFIYGACMP